LLNNVDGTPGADFIPDRLNQVVRIRGTVSSIDFRGGNGVEYYIQDATGGIDLFNSGTNFGPFAIGDTIEALGTVTHFNGLTELSVTALSLISHDTHLPHRSSRCRSSPTAAERRSRDSSSASTTSRSREGCTRRRTPRAT